MRGGRGRGGSPGRQTHPHHPAYTLSTSDLGQTLGLRLPFLKCDSPTPRVTTCIKERAPRRGHVPHQAMRPHHLLAQQQYPRKSWAHGPRQSLRPGPACGSPQGQQGPKRPPRPGPGQSNCMEQGAFSSMNAAPGPSPGHLWGLGDQVWGEAEGPPRLVGQGRRPWNADPREGASSSQ